MIMHILLIAVALIAAWMLGHALEYVMIEGGKTIKNFRSRRQRAAQPQGVLDFNPSTTQPDYRSPERLVDSLSSNPR